MRVGAVTDVADGEVATVAEGVEGDAYAEFFEERSGSTETEFRAEAKGGDAEADFGAWDEARRRAGRWLERRAGRSLFDGLSSVCLFGGLSLDRHSVEPGESSSGKEHFCGVHGIFQVGVLNGVGK